MARLAPLARWLVPAALLAAAGCGRAPKLAEVPPEALPVEAEPKIVISSALADPATRLLTVTYELTDRGTPLTLADVAVLKPTWILAWLSTEPVSGLPAWRSMLLTGGQTIGCLPSAGPGTPGSCAPLSGSHFVAYKQPGTETGGTTAALPDGRFTYTFKDPLPPPGATDLLDETLRVAVYLGGATGAARTNSSLDFVPRSTATTPARYDTVTDAKCNACHGVLSAHGGRRIGVKLCVACHTWLQADPDTVDPAALNGSLAATRATFPNPLEMGRMVHRIHRGKNLPTLYKASDYAAAPANRTWPPDYLSSGATWPASAFSGIPPLPFAVGRNAVADVGTKYSVIGHYSAEFVFGRVASRIENFQPATTLAEGVGYPQDLRNCDACHANEPGLQYAAIGTTAPDPADPSDPTDPAYAVSISRRTCSGCHPDVFYGDPNDLGVLAPDTTHLAHTGGRQLDDAKCKDCHVLKGATVPKLYAPIREIHRPLNDRAPKGSPNWSRVRATITGVDAMKPGQFPVVRFKLSDDDGPISPIDAPVPANDTIAPLSPVPRRMTLLALVLSGPRGTDPAIADYLTKNVVMRASLVSRLGAAPWWTIATGFGTAADPVTHEFTYTFTSALPADAIGTWAIGIEGRRRPDASTASAAPDYRGILPIYDVATDTFNWPYTGETISEHLTNDVKYVDLATGNLLTDSSRARRSVVDQEKCEKCHMELSLHGANRHDVAHCNLCHAPDATDWDKRPRDTRTLTDGGVVGTAMVLLNGPIDATQTTKRWGYATVDGIEERSIHLKTMVHRIHVGERAGAASLEGIRPFAIYGNASATAKPMVIFFDDIRYPNDLANCEVCHLEGKWTIEAIPAGAQPTTANERGTILHTASFNADGSLKTAAVAEHTSSSEPKLLPVTATCLSCHTNGAAAKHATENTSAGVEQCVSCHGESGAVSIRSRHAVP